MADRKKSTGKATILESALALALMGILAGAAGGLAVGIVTGRPSTSAAAPGK